LNPCQLDSTFYGRGVKPLGQGNIAKVGENNHEMFVYSVFV
jgi:hypothetical protein